ncbi:MAG: hypothetical protein WCY41_00820 [Candidatus Micrarchaeia archaeon]
MANITLSVPELLYARMQEHSEYKWSEIARKAIEQKIDEAEFLDDLRSAAEAKTARKAGKLISYRDAAKRLGIKP